MWLIIIIAVFFVLSCLAIFSGVIGDIANILLFFLKWAGLLVLLFVIVMLVVTVLNGGCGLSPG